MKSRLLPPLLLFPILLGQAQPAAPTAAPPASTGKIDRQALVTRHNLTFKAADPFGALAVGNGDFAFNADITGLQSFPAYYEKTTPVGILSSWGWHSFPNPEGYTIDKFQMRVIPKNGREFQFPHSSTSNPKPDAAWLRLNPHKFGLARIGLDMTKADGSPVLIADLKDIEQKLDLWTGILTSSFTIDGTPVKVETASHGTRDEVATRITSPLLANGRIKLHVAFPYATTSFGPDFQDWTKPEAHQTTLQKGQAGTATFNRTLDDTKYTVATRFSPNATLNEGEKHHYTLTVPGDTLEFTAWFSPTAVGGQPDTVDGVLAASRDHWKNYWSNGGMIDLSGNEDPRAAELERRLVLSQYVMAVHDASSYPPAETGLAANSWFGKYHMEMYWWHTAHWGFWGRPELIEKSLKNLKNMMPPAEAMAKRQGAKGYKWSKMTSPNGVESPSGVGAILVWQQPHPIYLAELVYRAKKDRATLEAYKDIVLGTANYMATFVDWDPVRKQYVLGPAVASADEGHTDYEHNLNPTMEIGYWKWAIKTAQEWRIRLGMPPDETYAKVIAGIAPPTVRNGIYPTLEKPEENTPSWMATWLYGILPGEDIDKAAMRRTLDAVVKSRLQSPQTAVTWGNGILAICAARMGDPVLATNLLVVPYENEKTNPFRPNGYTVRRPEQTPMYMPANGAWLSAAAIMAAGWDGNTTPNPGFPKNWKVRHEGLIPAP